MGVACLIGATANCGESAAAAPKKRHTSTHRAARATSTASAHHARRVDPRHQQVAAAVNSIVAKAAEEEAASAGAPASSASAEPKTSEPEPHELAASPSAAPPAGSADGPCGVRNGPRCPLQNWMATHVKTAFVAGDAKALAAALRAVALDAPPAYSAWSSMALEGATAVERSKDASAGRDSCRSCHLAYRQKYQTEMRNRPLRSP